MSGKCAAHGMGKVLNLSDFGTGVYLFRSDANRQKLIVP